MNTIAKRILSNAQKYPQKIAIVDHDGTRETTWTQLLEVATKISCHARREGLSGIVPILQGRTMEYVASILGLNMAGIAVVNLTDTYPKERVNYICEDVGATVCVDDAFVERAMDFPAEPFEFCCDLSDIAMLLYTSGSTGTPKGIVFDNECVLHCITRNIKEFELDEIVIYASTASFSFGVVQLELLATLAAGATLHILTEDCRKDIAAMTEYLNKYQVTHAFIPYQLFRQIQMPLPFMKLVLLAGEKMSDMVLRTYKTMVCYGLTETMPFATCFALDNAYAAPPIGKPCSGMTVYLLDENGNICDEGEICVAGGIAKGYWNCPELTEKTFVPNPFATGEHDEIILYTGDIGKRLPDGNLLFLNRNDYMVKISGQRVEPGEIEVVMQQLPEVEQAMVKAFVNARGLTYLCGFYTVNSPVSENAIRSHLAKNLPSYMQPRHLTQLVTFPTNINGKLDMLSLEAPKAAEFQEEYFAPETPEEALICCAFETVLDVKPIGVLDDFFRMGGDSLGVMQLMVEAEQLHLKTGHVFNGKTPRGIAALLQSNDAEKVDSYSNCQEERSFYPLTSAQRFMFRAYLMDPLCTTFNISAVYQFPLDADARRIREALLAVFAHYPILKVKVIEQDGVYGMVECHERSLDIRIEDIQEQDIPQKKKEFAVPFNPMEDLFIRMILYRTEKQIYLFWDAWHIIMDGSSATLFFNQFVRAYNSELLTSEQLTQFHLSNHEQKYLMSALFLGAQNFFDQKLTGHIFPSEPAFDHPENTGGVREGRNSFRMLSGQGLVDRLDRFINIHEITAATFFMGALADTLKQMTQNDQVYFLCGESGRHDLRLQNTLGQLVQHMPITVSFKTEATVIERLRQLQTNFLQSWFYDCYPFELLESKYGVSSSIVFVYQGELENGFSMLDQEIPMEFLVPQSIYYNLILCVIKIGNQYGFRVGYNSEAYESSTIDKLIDTYVQTINSFLLLLD